MSAKLLGAYQRHSSTSPAGTFGLNDRIGPKDRKKISKFGRKIQIPLPIVYTKTSSFRNLSDDKNRTKKPNGNFLFNVDLSDPVAKERFRAEVYAVNQYLKLKENMKFIEEKQKGVFHADTAYDSDDSDRPSNRQSSLKCSVAPLCRRSFGAV